LQIQNVSPPALSLGTPAQLRNNKIGKTTYHSSFQTLQPLHTSLLFPVHLLPLLVFVKCVL